MGSRCLSVGWAVLSLWLGPDAQIPDSRGERFAGEALLPPPTWSHRTTLSFYRRDSQHPQSMGGSLFTHSCVSPRPPRSGRLPETLLMWV